MYYKPHFSTYVCYNSTIHSIINMNLQQRIANELQRVDRPVTLEYLEHNLGMTKRQVKETVWKMKEQELLDFDLVWHVKLK